MTTLIVIFSVILLILGLIGSVLPIIPGPPVSFIGLLLLHLFTPFFLSEDILIYFALAAAIITFLDYWLQIYSVKIFGGGRASTIGVIIGILFGVFLFPPFGVIVGPFIGAYVGAIIESDFDLIKSFKIAFGSLIGFLGGTVLKFIYSSYVIWEYVSFIF
mgnify:FL=1|jgi:uncharacterized protein YqgC (DUF456 family)|tara:strand:+ start:397 stop:876 length:480 start_codon:yes stop_codon:yes gene_type:complete